MEREKLLFSYRFIPTEFYDEDNKARPVDWTP